MSPGVPTKPPHAPAKPARPTFWRKEISEAPGGVRYVLPTYRKYKLTILWIQLIDGSLWIENRFEKETIYDSDWPHRCQIVWWSRLLGEGWRRRDRCKGLGTPESARSWPIVQPSSTFLLAEFACAPKRKYRLSVNCIRIYIVCWIGGGYLDQVEWMGNAGRGRWGNSTKKPARLSLQFHLRGCEGGGGHLVV